MYMYTCAHVHVYMYMYKVVLGHQIVASLWYIHVCAVVLFKLAAASCVMTAIMALLVGVCNKHNV